MKSNSLFGTLALASLAIIGSAQAVEQTVADQETVRVASELLAQQLQQNNLQLVAGSVQVVRAPVTQKGAQQAPLNLVYSATTPAQQTPFPGRAIVFRSTKIDALRNCSSTNLFRHPRDEAEDACFTLFPLHRARDYKYSSERPATSQYEPKQIPLDVRLPMSDRRSIWGN